MLMTKAIRSPIGRSYCEVAMYTLPKEVKREAISIEIFYPGTRALVLLSVLTQQLNRDVMQMEVGIIIP